MKWSATLPKNWASRNDGDRQFGLIAILFDEPEGPECTKALEAASPRPISAVNYVETRTVHGSRPIRKSGCRPKLDTPSSRLSVSVKGGDLNPPPG